MAEDLPKPFSPASDDEKVKPQEVRINSDNFLPYLAGIYDDENVRLVFSNQLNLPDVAGGLKELAETTQEGDIYESKQKEQILKGLTNKSTPQSELTQNLVSGLREEMSRLANRRGHVERSRSLYLDLTNKAVRFSDIRQHQYTHGEVDTGEIFARGDLPLIEVHTHPKDVLPSPVDYFRLLVKVSGGNTRLLKCAIILGPNVQILALATPETALLEPDQLRKEIDAATDLSDDEKKRQDQLMQRLSRVTKGGLEWPVKRAESMSQSFLEINRMYEKGLLTEAEELRLRDEESKKTKHEVEEYGAKTRRIHNKAFDKLFSYEERQFNTKLMQFARDMRIKLYFSTNFQDFFEFTA